MDYIRITFADLQPEQKEILIAQLADAGYEGFEEADEGLDAFISKKDFDKSLLNEISYKYQTPYTSKKIAATNWNKIWESNFEPVIVEDYVAVRADFHQPITTTKYEIIITPKMSFGTGHHATTYMMIEMMKEIEFDGKTVLDFGTGTGILAILADKGGAKEVHAIDNDDWSIANAEENFKRNECKNIFLKKASDTSSATSYDLILANINKNVILENFDVLKDQLKNEGILLLSGLLETDRNDILRKAKKLNLSVKKIINRNNWIAIQLSK
jgi:ribosomal protein L11 methyltransferase